jgi:ribosome-binding factor A
VSRDRAQRTKAPSQRQLRVGELIRHTLAEMLQRGEVRDPDLEGLVVTVTEVRPSPDLKVATVYIMPLGGVGGDLALAALGRAAPYLRGRIAREVDLRFAPELRFALDTTFDEATRIENLLRSPRVARDLEQPSDEDDDDGA